MIASSSLAGQSGISAALLPAIAQSVGTPAYVYDAAEIRRAYTSFDAALGSYPHAIHYALKANSTLGLVRLLRRCACARQCVA